MGFLITNHNQEAHKVTKYLVVFAGYKVSEKASRHQVIPEFINTIWNRLIREGGQMYLSTINQALGLSASYIIRLTRHTLCHVSTWACAMQ